ncbi:hypothetical protein ACFLYF_02205 [Chloroflexota bacterium]
MNRVGEEKERHGAQGLAYFYQLVDMRNKVLTISLTEKVPPVPVVAVKSEVAPGNNSLDWVLTEQRGKRKILNRR